MRVNPTPKLIAWLLFALISGGALALASWYPLGYIRFTYEDLYAEWAQFYLFVFLFVAAARAAWRLRGPQRHFLLLLAMLALYTFMEEISWGQRLLAFETPYLFEQYNLQQETNLHNFFAGPLRTWTKTVLEWALAGALLMYGLALPLLERRSRTVRHWIARLGVVTPPAWLAPYFLTAAVCELSLLHFNEAEIAELLVASSLLITVIVKTARSESRSAPVRRATEATDGRSIAGVFLLAALLSAGTTQLIYHSPAGRQALEERVLAGVEKFARRYENRGNWARAAEFYAIADAAHPGRRSILLGLARSYQALQDEARYRAVHLRLLAQQSRDADGHTDQFAVEFSLAQSLTRVGQHAAARQHLEQAKALAMARAAANPDDPEAHYWLGRVYQFAGDQAAALAQYRQAASLSPERAKYERAIALLTVRGQ
ncbi:MAG: hypothetical protein D6727_10750 [Gammaproteobacteria bacterium]|nr:MAG: hypothetical protein D6727_10750 [Gammaproteobacteria bacterium]